ncbi:MAG: PIN domain-containing protein [Anaerolineales bacterium]|nr:PIN domain-containing protein [Anaerolineales bacterium]
MDTNIWLERLLDQAKSEEVGRFLSDTPPNQLIISDFSLHSIGVILDRLDKQAVFAEFVDDVLIQGGVALRNVPPDLMRRLVDVIDAFKLDFDDAYQYVVAERTQATIVSFDKDFDRTSLGRKSPERV